MAMVFQRATVVPGVELIVGACVVYTVVRAGCEVVRTGCEVVRPACDVVRTACDAVRTACTIVNSQKPGAFNSATAALSQTQATANLPAEFLGCFDKQGTPPHFRQPTALPVVDNGGHVCYCIQCNRSMQTNST